MPPVKAKPQAAAAKPTKKKKMERDDLETKDSSLLDLDDCKFKSTRGHYVAMHNTSCIPNSGAAPTSTVGGTVSMGTNDLLTPISAGLEGLSLGASAFDTATFQVHTI